MSFAGPESRTLGPITSGGEEIRTPDPLLAKQVLYQLSYAPSVSGLPPPRREGDRIPTADVGVPGFEPGTSALSELRSSQLSYTPCFAVTAGKQQSQTDDGLALSPATEFPVRATRRTGKSESC